MNIRVSCVAAASLMAFASNANATIVGSTYDFTTSVTGNTTISPLGATGAHTAPNNPGFCVGPPLGCSTGSGVSGSFSFAQSNSTMDTITFTFFGSTAGAGPGSFSIDLSNFKTLDNETIQSVIFGSGSLGGATSAVSFNGTDAIFKFTTGSDYNALGGTNVVFDVNTAVATPGPIVGAGLPGLIMGGGGLLGLWRRKRKAVAAA